MLRAQSALTVMLQACEGTPRVAVRGNAAPAGLPAGRMRGLAVVARLAAHWGVLPLGTAANAVWAGLPLT
jgi:hypothetical protein